MADFWWLFALFKAWGGATTVLLTERSLRTSVELLWLRSLFALLFFSASFYFMLPESYLFYLGAVAVGLLVFMGDKIIFHSCKNFGSLAVSRFMPLSIFGSFFLWLFVDAEQRETLILKPELTLAIAIALLGAVGSIAVMRKGSKASHLAFFALLPTIVIFAFCDLFSTLSVQSQPPFVGAMSFAFFVSLTVFLCATVSLFLKREKMPQLKLNFPLFLAIGIAHSLATLGMMAAFYYAPNPGFVAALGLSVPIWVLLYHKLKKTADVYENIKAVFVFMLSAFSLVLLSSQL